MGIMFIIYDNYDNIIIFILRIRANVLPHKTEVYRGYYGPPYICKPR